MGLLRQIAIQNSALRQRVKFATNRWVLSTVAFEKGELWR